MLTCGQNFAIAPSIYFLFPETARLSLEEIDHIFIKDDVVSNSSASQTGAESYGIPKSHEAGGMEVRQLE